jgi:hypothetical protein
VHDLIYLLILGDGFFCYHKPGLSLIILAACVETLKRRNLTGDITSDPGTRLENNTGQVTKGLTTIELKKNRGLPCRISNQNVFAKNGNKKYTVFTINIWV